MNLRIQTGTRKKATARVPEASADSSNLVAALPAGAIRR